jgi:hypothetical protein
VKGTAGQTEIGGIGAHDPDGLPREPAAERRRPRRVQVDGDDTGPRRHEVLRDRAVAGTDVQHEMTVCRAGGHDQPAGPTVSEPVPPPPRLPRGGHDAP